MFDISIARRVFFVYINPVFFLKRVDGNRRRKQEALQRVAASGEEMVLLRLGLDAFGDDGHAELFAHVDDVVDDGVDHLALRDDGRLRDLDAELCHRHVILRGNCCRTAATSR